MTKSSRIYRELRQPSHSQQIFATVATLIYLMERYPSARKHREAIVNAMIHIEEDM
jgi:hypothetical protein